MINIHLRIFDHSHQTNCVLYINGQYITFYTIKDDLVEIDECKYYLIINVLSAIDKAFKSRSFENSAYIPRMLHDVLEKEYWH